MAPLLQEAAGTFSASLNLSALDGFNGFVINGIDDSDYSGYSVSSAGDVNGDGFDDLIIGASKADPNVNVLAGESYVVFGKAAGSFSASLELSSLLSSNGGDGSLGFVINGIAVGDFSGYSVSSAGDVNGDGFDDLIIGAFGAPNGARTGESYVVFGKADWSSSPNLELSTLDGSNGFVINGINSGDESGRSVSSAGDFNGDGYDDLIIGVSRADPNGKSNAGESYVVFGKAGGFGASLELSSLLSSNGGDGSLGFVINGIAVGDFSGYSVSSAGDFNGDGFDDLIIGAYRADPNGKSNAGESYVVFGKAGGFGASLELSSLLSSNGGDGSLGFVINGIDARDLSGFSVSSAGDVNGDGFDDLIIGASLADPNGAYSGESYIIYGFDSRGEVAQYGTTGDDAGATALVATGSDKILIGNLGDDELKDGGNTNTVMRGGVGDDTLFISNLDFAELDGGTGTDKLVLDGSVFSLSLDLTTMVNKFLDTVEYRISDIEIIDLGSGAGNTLKLNKLSLLKVTGSHYEVAGSNILQIDGGLNDILEFDLNEIWIDVGTVSINGQLYNQYMIDKTTVRIAPDIRTTSLTISTTTTTGLRIQGEENNDVLNGSGGDDLILGFGGADDLNGDDGNDTLTGGDGNDTLSGGDGNDTLSGGADADDLDGGNGNDTASYANSNSGVSVALSTSGNSRGDAEGDSLTDIENLIGSSFVDALTGDDGDNIIDGGAGNDFLFGGAGNDILDGGAGNDILDGGNGNDTASYANSNSGVFVAINVVAIGGDAQGDILTGMENLTGSSHDDVLAGDGGDNTISGGDGNDTLTGGVGADKLDGGDGNDTASYTNSNSAVTVWINRGSDKNTDGDAAGDTLTNIENLTGSSFDDTLVGDGGDNIIDGGLGDDFIDGGAGNDILDGGDGDDDIKGFAGADILMGGAGNDVLTGLAGNDTLIGGEGNDTLTGGTGSDLFIFLANSGVDIITDFDGVSDKIDLTAYSFTGFNDLLLGQTFFNTLITLAEDTIILLQNVVPSSLDADDFIF